MGEKVSEGVDVKKPLGASKLLRYGALEAVPAPRNDLSATRIIFGTIQFAIWGKCAQNLLQLANPSSE